MIKLTIIESAADKDLYDDLYSYADEYRMTSRWTKDNVEKYLKRQKDFRRMSDADFDKVVAKVNKDFKRKKKVKSDPYSETSYKTESKRFNISKRLHEQDVEIEVKHEGILEVPDGKNVDDLPFSHFEKLAKEKGLGKITKALNNLQVWNKNDDKKLSKWAGDMIDKLNKKLDKKESLLRLNEKDNFNGSITSAADYYYPRWKSEVMDSSQIRDELVRRFGHSEDFADEVLELIFDKYDDDQRYWDEYDESLIHKKLKKDESANRVEYRKRKKVEAAKRQRSTRGGVDKVNSVGKFLDTQIERGKIDEKQVTVVYDKNNNIMWLGKAGFYPLFMSNIEYRSSGYDADHPNELWINARSYTKPFGESVGRNKGNVKLDFEIIHDSDDDEGNPTLWGAEVNSHHYGKFMWIELSDVDGYYDLVYNAGGDRYKTIKSFMSFNKAKKFAEDLIRQEKIEYDEIDESLKKESPDRYDPNIEARFIDDSDVFLRDDIPNESVFVGVSKTKPMTYGTMGDTLYDEIFTFDNDYDEAWKTAMKWNMKGYYVEFDRALDGDVVEKNLFKPREMNKYLSTPLKNESKGLGGRDFGYVDEVLQEYLDFLDEAGIEVINVVPEKKMIYVDRKGFDDATFYMQDRDYFGKDLYSKGWMVATRA